MPRDFPPLKNLSIHDYSILLSAFFVPLIIQERALHMIHALLTMPKTNLFSPFCQGQLLMTHFKSSESGSPAEQAARDISSSAASKAEAPTHPQKVFWPAG